MTEIYSLKSLVFKFIESQFLVLYTFMEAYAV